MLGLRRRQRSHVSFLFLSLPAGCSQAQCLANRGLRRYPGLSSSKGESIPFGKSEDKKQEAADRKALQGQAEQARKDAAAEAQRQAEHEASPVGRAEAKRAAGSAFFQIEIDVSQLAGSSGFGSSTGRVLHTGGRPDLRTDRRKGWKLEHVGYVFIETGSTTTNRVMSTGQGMVTRGNVTGIYLFRAV